MLDLRGNPDLFGRILQVSISGFADEIAAAASLVMGQGDEAQPVVLVRGLTWKAPANPARPSWCVRRRKTLCSVLSHDPVRPARACAGQGGTF